MASPILHIKDSYYFEVPKSLWRYNYTSLDQVPAFLREGHPHATVEQFNKELSGKILIPQPPGAHLKNLYEKASDSGFAVSKFMVMELVVALLMALVFVRLATRMKNGDAPRGRAWNLFESMLLFVRDEIARPAIDSHDDHGHDDHGHGDGHGHGHHGHAAHALPKHDGDKFVPLLWTMFFFVLFCNLFGLVPWAGSPTGGFAVTLGLAAVTFATVLVSGMKKFGLVGFWLNQVPQMDLPWYMVWLKIPIFVIEVGGMAIRHGILAVRLLANMVAGHVVLLGIMGLAFSIEGAASPSWKIAAPISVLASTLFSVLELFVAFLQAYIFTFLSALFIGSANHRH